VSRVLRNVGDVRERARRRLPRPVFEFVDGGSEDERTMSANRLGFQDYRFTPKLFVDVSQRDLSTTIGGEKLDLPIMFAPTGLVGLVHPDGELAAARVAARNGTIAIVSGHATYSLEEVAREVPEGASRWFNLFPWRDRSFYGAVIERAQAAGYTGLCLTVDTTVASNRERDIANGFTAPPRLTANAGAYLRHPAWIASVLRHRRCTLRNFAPDRPSLRTFVQRAAESAAASIEFLSPQMSWDDLAWIRASWDGTLALKGAFTPDDAVRAADVGVNVLLVGNHGGRQLDGLQTGLEQLPGLVDAVGNRVELILDGGVRRGSDVAKALCVGARACTIGRAWVYGLGAGGTRGVETVLAILRRELDMVLALVGAPSVAALDASYVARAHARDTSTI
jgi:isopentenyl diphosphate isomerase/L-lactate dehydrogenase-like FMN-dependent dehydrogenase